jgi:hypothetical protein
MSHLDDAIAEFEEPLTVHDAVGFAGVAASVDMSRAPTGERYVTLTSGGLKPEGQHVPAWFADEADAIEWWLAEAKPYAEKHGKQLYWRERPELVTASYVMLDQVNAIRNGRLRESVAVDLHFVFSRLLVSTKDPSGTVIDVI